MRARAFARSPKEPTLDGGFRDVPSVAASTPHQTTCGTARDLSFLPSRSVDLVLTDPPYFDNIAYSELAEFFLPWLRLLDVVSDARGAESVMLQSLVARRSDPESIKRYTAGLRDAFGEVGTGLEAGKNRHLQLSPHRALGVACASTGNPSASTRGGSGATCSGRGRGWTAQA